MEQGIDSISVEPDAILKITLRVAEVEERLAAAKRAVPVPLWGWVGIPPTPPDR